MHKLDLDLVKRRGHIDLAQYIGAKTIRNALPARAKEAVHFLKTFSNRELTGTVLHDKNYKDVLKTRQQILDGTKLPDVIQPELQPASDPDSGLNASGPAQDIPTPRAESQLQTPDPDPTDQEGGSYPGLPGVEQPDEGSQESDDPKSTIDSETIFRY